MKAMPPSEPPRSRTGAPRPAGGWQEEFPAQFVLGHGQLLVAYSACGPCAREFPLRDGAGARSDGETYLVGGSLLRVARFEPVPVGISLRGGHRPRQTYAVGSPVRPGLGLVALQVDDALGIRGKDGPTGPGRALAAGGACRDGHLLIGGEPADPDVHRLVRQRHGFVQSDGGRPAVFVDRSSPPVQSALINRISVTAQTTARLLAPRHGCSVTSCRRPRGRGAEGPRGRGGE